MDYIITQKVYLKKKIYFLPQDIFFDRFNGIHVWYSLTEEEEEELTNTQIINF